MSANQLPINEDEARAITAANVEIVKAVLRAPAETLPATVREARSKLVLASARIVKAVLPNGETK